MSGEFAPSKQRSLIQPIQAFKNNFFVQVNFLSNLGTIDVYIYNEYGAVVYQEAVNTAVEREISIDISSLSSGEYTIRFVNSQNRYMQGDFEI
ncbi:hypothetical protein FACS189437_08180 [Bacteroidia bacterium]|nr:hypothetical protein FACS189437_08180 [Bacteroidia bacterium]